jgi:hypothetical protein
MHHAFCGFFGNLPSPHFFNSSRNAKVATKQAGMPVSGSIQGAEKVRPGRTLRKGFIGQYHSWVEQIHSHERQELLDWGGLVPLSL